MKGKTLPLFALRKMALFGVVLFGLAWVGFKLVVHAQLLHAANVVAMQLQGSLTLEYQRVTSELDGRVGLFGVTLKPHGLSDEIRIGELSVKFPSLLYFLRLDEHAQRKEYPHALSVRMRDVAFSTRGELAQNWEALMFLNAPDARPAALANCVAHTSLPTRLRLLDYAEIRGNFDLGYQFDPQNHQLFVRAVGGHEQGVEFRGEFALVMRALDSLNLLQVASNPEIAHASIEIDDDSYYDRVFQYRERGGGVSKEMVVALLAQDLVEMLDGLPLQLDGPLLAAYSQFVSAGSHLKVTANPLRPTKLQHLSLYEPSAVPALLNLQTHVN